MLIDADTHISPIEADNRISAEELVSIMDKAGVDKAMAWLQPPCEVSESNKYVYESMQKYPDQILGFGWADPREGVDVAIENVKKCAYEYDLYGIKLNGAQNEFYIDDEKLAMPLIEEIAKTGKLLAFHIGADAPERTNPKRVANICDKFPEIKVLMIHMGGAGTPDISEQVIAVAQEYEQTYLIGSHVGSQPILNAVQTLGADRVCFGSDTPFVAMPEVIEKYNTLLEGEVNKKEKDKIMGGNIEKLLEL